MNTAVMNAGFPQVPLQQNYGFLNQAGGDFPRMMPPDMSPYGDASQMSPRSYSRPNSARGAMPPGNEPMDMWQQQPQQQPPPPQHEFLQQQRSPFRQQGSYATFRPMSANSHASSTHQQQQQEPSSLAQWQQEVYDQLQQEKMQQQQDMQMQMPMPQPMQPPMPPPPLPQQPPLPQPPMPQQPVSQFPLQQPQGGFGQGLSAFGSRQISGHSNMTTEPQSLAQWQHEVQMQMQMQKQQEGSRPHSARSQGSNQGSMPPPPHHQDELWLQQQPPDQQPQQQYDQQMGTRPVSAWSQNSGFANGSTTPPAMSYVSPSVVPSNASPNTSRPVSAKGIGQYSSRQTSAYSSAPDFHMKPATASAPNGYYGGQGEVGSDAPTNASRDKSGKPPDFVLDSEGWFQHYDQWGSGMERHELQEALRKTWTKSSPEFVQNVVRRIWNTNNTRMTCEEFVSGQVRRTLLMYMGDPPLNIADRGNGQVQRPAQNAQSPAPVPRNRPGLPGQPQRPGQQAQQGRQQSPRTEQQDAQGRSRSNPTGAGKNVIVGRNPNGTPQTKVLPPGVMGMSLYDGNEATMIKTDIPLGVKQLLEAKGAMDVFNRYVDALLTTLEGKEKKAKWKADAMRPIVQKFRPQFEQKQLNTFVCQAPSVDDRIFKWLEFVDRKEKPLYQSPDRIAGGSEACTLM